MGKCLRRIRTMIVMRFWSYIVLLCSLCPCLSSAHRCDDGSSVVCQNMTNSADAPTSAGGKDAEGFALTHQHGHTLYCLVDHSYHDCPGGQEACCLDGSKPAHDSDDDKTLVVGLSVSGGSLLLLICC